MRKSKYGTDALGLGKQHEAMYEAAKKLMDEHLTLEQRLPQPEEIGSGYRMVYQYSAKRQTIRVVVKAPDGSLYAVGQETNSVGLDQDQMLGAYLTCHRALLDKGWAMGREYSNGVSIEGHPVHLCPGPSKCTGHNH